MRTPSVNHPTKLRNPRNCSPHARAHHGTVMPMGATARLLKYAPLFRIWDPVRRGFGFTDQRPNDASIVEAWTGRFDREGRPIYEQDIISVHHDWKLGWVRALVERRTGPSEFAGTVTGPDGVFHIAAYQFADAYLEGNCHQHPHHLFAAVAQFPDPEPSSHLRWWSDGVRLPGAASKTQSRRNRGTRALDLSNAGQRTHQRPGELWTGIRPLHDSACAGALACFHGSRSTP